MSILHKYTFYIFLTALFLFAGSPANAATLKLNPSTGVYTVGNSFTVSVLLNTEGKSVNAADGQLSFNAKELQVVGVSRSSSIFNLWTEEPAYSNSAGTVTFGGGSPTGYKGASGSIVTVTFKALGAGTPKVNFKSGSALAADGLGTNVLTAMSSGTYTIAAKSDSPAPEYIPPANTPVAPKINSSSHPDETKWYKEKNALLTWELPKDVTSVRMILDENSGTVPTKVYDERLTEKSIEDLAEGVSYFHLQFKNADGWGRITHYKLSVDSESPKNFSVTEEKIDTNNPSRALLFTSEDTSPILEYKIQIDGKDPFVYKDESLSKKYVLEPLLPGYHTITVEAFDSAGNTAVASYSLTIEAFEKPIFIDYPTRINTEVIPAIKGKTRPNAIVNIAISKASGDTTANADEGNNPYEVTSNEAGEFIFIPDTTLDQGVYIISATARDSYGSVSEKSDEIKIIVDAPGYVVFGSMLINILSVVVPVTALILLLIFGTWYLWHKLILWKRRVLKETLEAESKLASEFDMLATNLNQSVTELREARKSKLTKAESSLIEKMETDIASARTKIAKEIVDIEQIVK